MVKLPKVPDTPEDFHEVVHYVRSTIFLAKCDTPTKKSNFQRRCKHFVYDSQHGYLFYVEPPKNENSQCIPKRVVPAFDTELKEALFQKFHDGAAHFDSKKTYNMIYERHIGITQDEVKKYVRNCPTCIRNTSIKEKTDITPVVSDGPLQHIQIDLVDFLSYAEHNDGYSYVLTMIDIFSRYVWAIPLCDKEGGTIHTELLKFFMNFGPVTKLQADNGSEFITTVLKHTCEVFGIKLVHGRARHPQSQGKIERFNQTLGRHLTKMMWDEVEKVQWIDILPSFIIAYNKVSHEAHKKSPYEAFFGFKMRGVYNTLDNNPNNTEIPANNTLADIPTNDTPTDTLANDTPADTLANDTPADTLTAQETTQVDEFNETTRIVDAQVDNMDEITQIFGSQVAVYESHVIQVERIRKEIAQNDEIYRNKMVNRASIHRRKPAFEQGDEVSIAPDHDTNQKTRKRKFEQICSMTGKVIGMCSNNRTVKVEVNGEVKNYPIKNVRKLKGQGR